MRRLPLLLLLLLAGPLLAAEPPDLPSTHEVVAFLGRPADPVAVADGLTAAIDYGPEACAVLARALGYAGGLAILDPLRTFLRHRDVGVRIEALRSVARADLRVEDLLVLVRRIADERRGTEQHLAFRVLGRLGDARDFPRLLAAAAQEEPILRAEGFTALRMLTGARLPDSLARWQYWWRTALPRLRGPLHDVLAAPAGERVVAAERERRTALLGERAWLDLPRVTARLGVWLGSRDDRLRIAACDAAARARLGSLAADIQRRLDSGYGSEAFRQAAGAALVELGILPPPPSRPAKASEESEGGEGGAARPR